MVFLRTLSALSRLQSGKQYSLQNAVRGLQTLSHSDLDLHSHLKDIISEEREVLRKLNAKRRKLLHRSIDDMRADDMGAVRGLLWDTSDEGIQFCGPTFAECLDLLPAAKPGEEPLPEGLLWLLLTGKVPHRDQVDTLSNELRSRATVPDYVYKAIDALPDSANPITQFVSGVMALQVQSEFQKACEKGIHKSEYWEPTYEDCLNLIARLPLVAAYVYRRIYKDDQFISMDGSLDYGANFSHMLGFDNPKMHEFMRLFVTIHSYDEDRKVSAHTGRIAGSVLLDPYLSFAAALDGLAGPLHGLANQEDLLWIKCALKECGENISTEKLEEYVLKIVNSGKSIPTIARRWLHKGNPRYTWPREFALKHLPEDPLFQMVSKLDELRPVAEANTRANVDVHSGVLLNHFGLTEARYYTVLFGVSISIEICSQLIWDRALWWPDEMMKSGTMGWLENYCKKEAASS